MHGLGVIHVRPVSIHEITNPFPVQNAHQILDASVTTSFAPCAILSNNKYS